MELDIANINILNYSFIGDAVFSLLTREYILKTESGKISTLHAKTTKIVNAKTQALMLDYLKENNLLTESEQEVSNRARNAKTNSIPKNASLAEYKKSTSLEAIFGYNFFLKNEERNKELFSCIVEIINKKEKTK